MSEILTRVQIEQSATKAHMVMTASEAPRLCVDTIEAVEASHLALHAAMDAAMSREAVLRDMARHLATNPDDLIAEEGGARHLAILALSRCYTLDVLEDGSCFDPYTAAAADSHEDGQS